MGDKPKKSSTTPVSVHKLGKDATNAQIAKKWMVSEAAMSRWSKEIDIRDDEAVIAHIRKLPDHNKPKNWQHLKEFNTSDEASLKNRKLELEILRKEFDLAVLMGNYTSNEDIREVLIRAGSQIKAGLRKVENSLASELEGAKAPEIQSRMAEEHDALYEEWSDTTSNLYLLNHGTN